MIARPVLAGNDNPLGADLYRQYCATCHGHEGRGDGPVADALRRRPADLTQIARRNGGKFPELRVMSFIKGDLSPAAHGSREMPMWGRVFQDMNGNRQELVQMQIYSLLRWVEQLQAQ